ncbi:MAG: molybdopterin-dependent oxidoreductase [Coriobacteriia bacterium]|nr:molybdopterin-dependent oxidoreductase [Coriobacteriia bacterium]
MSSGDRMISRRSFVGAATAASVALAMAGCSPENKVTETTESAEKVYRQDPEFDPETGGKWVTAACWHNCGGRCLNRAYVVDNIVLRQKTDDLHEDSPDYPQQRACLRGRSQQQLVFGADRIKYPMKRKNWQPGGGDKSLRGKDEWERISWDEALDYVAAELKTTIDTYGPGAILTTGSGFSSSTIGPLLCALGGTSLIIDSQSFGVFAAYDITTTIGLPMMGMGTAQDRISLRKSEQIVLYGCNPGWASGGNPSYHLLQAKKAGAEFTFVGPEYNVTASMLEARWIAIRPGTDTAFLLAVAYEMIQLDKDGTIIDHDFLDKYTVGYDEDHMPADAELNENFKDSVLGAYDGTPKTAEWASEICGASPEDIRWFAALVGKGNKTSLLHSFAPARCNDAESFPQLFYAIAAMGGHWSGEGHSCGSIYHGTAANAGGALVNPGNANNGVIPREVPEHASIKGPEAWVGILEGKYNYTGNRKSRSGIDAPSEVRDIDIHLIYNDRNSAMNTCIGVPKAIEVFRKVDFVVTQDFCYTVPAQYSDILLPVTTYWERVNCYNRMICNREIEVFPSKVVEPLYEAWDDIKIVSELTTKMGLDPKALFPNSDMQNRYIVLSGATAMGANGMAPIATITQEDINEWGVEGEPQEGQISLAELVEKGIFQVPRTDGDSLSEGGWDRFVNDPVQNKLPSPSGLFEIYCQQKANHINQQLRSTVKPYPNYVRPLNGYEDSFADWETKKKGEYPFQMITPHYLRRSHTTFDNSPWLRQAMENPVWLNSGDAKSLGIAEGDTVLLSNQYGKVLRIATLTERLMPGVVSLPHGARVVMDEATGIDIGGCPNTLSATVASGSGVSGYNTNLIKVEKYSGKALTPDYTWAPVGIDVE